MHANVDGCCAAELESQLQNQSLADTVAPIPIKSSAEPTPPLSVTPDSSALDISESVQEELQVPLSLSLSLPLHLSY